MSSVQLRALLGGGLLVLGGLALAADAPPLKPGLWLLAKQEMIINGKVQPSIAEQMKNMPPEIAAMMKGRMGIDASSEGLKMCFTKDSFDTGQWQSAGSKMGCTTTFSERSGKVWKGKTVCPNGTTDSEVQFVSPEQYVSKSITTSKMMGKTSVTENSSVMIWQSASCGDVKPFAVNGVTGK